MVGRMINFCWYSCRLGYYTVRTNDPKRLSKQTPPIIDLYDKEFSEPIIF